MSFSEQTVYSQKCCYTERSGNAHLAAATRLPPRLEAERNPAANDKDPAAAKNAGRARASTEKVFPLSARFVPNSVRRLAWSLTLAIGGVATADDGLADKLIAPPLPPAPSSAANAPEEVEAENTEVIRNAIRTATSRWNATSPKMRTAIMPTMAPGPLWD